MNLVKAITNGVEVLVKTYYSPVHSNPRLGRYFFVYTITIKNNNDFSVQLMSRHWNIYDSNGEFNQMRGKGVIGEQPVIESQQEYTYSSGCNLKSEIGKMSGFYTMLRLFDEKNFDVAIPEFSMVLEAKLN